MKEPCKKSSRHRRRRGRRLRIDARNDDPALATLGCNLLILAGLTVAVSMWLFFYTQHSPILGGFLATLGGAAVLSKIITEKRREELQKRYIETILENRRTSYAFLSLLCLFILVSSFTGAVNIDASTEERHRNVSFQKLASPSRNETAANAEHHLSPRSSKTFLLWTSWLGWKYRARLTDTPTCVDFMILPYRKWSIKVPHDFGREPVLLVVPTPGLTMLARRPSLDLLLSVTKNGTTIENAARYQGETLWIGGRCASDVPPPEDALDPLLAEAEREGVGGHPLKELKNVWSKALVFAQEDGVRAGDVLRLEILGRDKQKLTSIEVTVEGRRDPLQPFQQVTLGLSFP